MIHRSKPLCGNPARRLAVIDDADDQAVSCFSASQHGL